MKRNILLIIIALGMALPATAQMKFTQDTLKCPLVGFNFGTVFPSAKLSSDGGMYDLYKAPYLNFGLDFGYKFKSNWMVELDGNLMFGSDNLKNREARMGDLYTNDHTPIIIGTNGTDAEVTCHNRALMLRVGGGRIFKVNSRNPNSGIVGRAYVGLLQQKTIFAKNAVNAPQIDGDYSRLYDHKRRGLMLTESVGYWFMSNKANLVNLYVAFEVTECWTSPTRNYEIDYLMGLQGKDENSYFDLLYTLKVCWMFPLKGKTAYDLYYY
ncbi:MAG: hypothetical protein K5864_00390 [Bacteroidales bacterium]|nr:hypothetical protein [Bacteroidales bacterium]